MRRRKAPGFNIRLADAVAEVTADYVGFLRASRAGDADDPKAFAARHAAAKAALSHIEHLIKLAAASDEAAAERLGDCEDLLRRTRREMAAGEGRDDDGAAG